jgi:hypothetical protein
MISRWTSVHKTEEEARKDNNFVYVSTTKHRHTYGFQEGHWVPTLRQFYEPALNEWFNCDECSTRTGEPFNDSKGCWEPDTKHPVKGCNEP